MENEYRLEMYFESEEAWDELLYESKFVVSAIK